MANLENLGKLPQGYTKTTGVSSRSDVINVNPELIAQLQVLNTVNVPKELGLSKSPASNDGSYTSHANNVKNGGSGFGRS